MSCCAVNAGGYACRCHITLDRPNALTALAHVARAMRVVGELIEEHQRIARWLWHDEPEVQAWIDERGETAYEPPDHFNESRFTIRERTEDVAWDRYEPKGSREAAERRAVVVMRATHARARDDRSSSIELTAHRKQTAPCLGRACAGCETCTPEALAFLREEPAEAYEQPISLELHLTQPVFHAKLKL